MTALSVPDADHLQPAAHLGDGDALDGRVVSLDLRQVVAIIRGNVILISVLILASLIAGVVATMLMTPVYSAVSSMQVNQEAERVLDSEDRRSDGGFMAEERFLKTQLDVMRSEMLRGRVVQALKLDQDPAYFAAMGAELPQNGVGGREVARKAATGLLAEAMDVTLPEDSRIVSLTIHTFDPVISAKIANAYASEFIKSSLQRKFESSKYARDFITQQLEEAKGKLELSERQLNDYARTAGIIRTEASSSGQKDDGGSNTGGSIRVATLVQLNSASNNAKLARIAAEEKWKSFQATALLSNREVLSNPTIQGLLTERAEVQANLREESSRHLDDFPAVIQLRSRLAEVNSQIQVVAHSVRDSIRSDYRVAQAQEQATLSQSETARVATLEEQDRGVRYGILLREATTNRTMYDGLLQRHKELNAAAGISASNVSVIDQAEPPEHPSSPNLVLNMLIATIFGVSLAAIVVFVKEHLDDGVRVPEDVEQKLHLALLGVIPTSRGDSDLATELADPRSVISEAYNALRGNLLYSTSHGLPKLIMVTSGQASEGKSTTSQAISRGLARLGKRTLLVDVDLRRPSVHRQFGNENERGLTDVLTANAEWRDVILSTEYENLSVIQAGPIPPSPTELLASARMAELLEEWKQVYDVVLFDCPPVLGLADSPVLSGMIESTIFVIESGKGRRGATRTAIRRLRGAHGSLLGVVLTKFDIRMARNAYSDYYQYDYYHYGNKSAAAVKEAKEARAAAKVAAADA